MSTAIYSTNWTHYCVIFSSLTIVAMVSDFLRRQISFFATSKSFSASRFSEFSWWLRPAMNYISECSVRKFRIRILSGFREISRIPRKTSNSVIFAEYRHRYHCDKLQPCSPTMYFVKFSLLLFYYCCLDEMCTLIVQLVQEFERE